MWFDLEKGDAAGKWVDLRNYPSGLIAPDIMDNDLSMATIPIGNVPSDELANKYALFRQASLGTVISLENRTAYDFGQTVYHCYLWDFNSNNYRSVFLANIGDSTSYNSDPNAVELLDWLGVVFCDKRWKDWVSEQGTK